VTTDPKPRSRRWMLSLGCMPVLLIGLGIAIFAPLATCRWCEGSGRYTYVNRRAEACPGCHGAKKVGYLLMLYRLANLQRL
jgi:hypothetical protein